MAELGLPNDTNTLQVLGDLMIDQRLDQRIERSAGRILQEIQQKRKEQLESGSDEPPPGSSETLNAIKRLQQLLDVAHPRTTTPKRHNKIEDMDWADLDQLGIRCGDIRWKSGWPESVIQKFLTHSKAEAFEEAWKHRVENHSVARSMPSMYELVQFVGVAGQVIKPLQAEWKEKGFKPMMTCPSMDHHPVVLIRPDGTAAEITGKPSRNSYMISYFPLRGPGDEEDPYYDHPHFAVRPGIGRICFIQADPGNAHNRVPQAVLRAISYCHQYDLKTMRGCVASTDDWIFFIYTETPDETYHLWVSPTISMGVEEGDLTKNVDVALAVLDDWARNPNTANSEFFDLVPGIEVSPPEEADIANPSRE